MQVVAAANKTREAVSIDPITNPDTEMKEIEDITIKRKREIEINQPVSNKIVTRVIGEEMKNENIEKRGKLGMQ